MKRIRGCIVLALLASAWVAGGVEYRTRNIVKINSQTRKSTPTCSTSGSGRASRVTRAFRTSCALRSTGRCTTR